METNKIKLNEILTPALCGFADNRKMAKSDIERKSTDLCAKRFIDVACHTADEKKFYKDKYSRIIGGNI